VIYCRFRYFGEDPYAIYNGPGASPPAFPDRVDAFKHACGMYAYEMDVRLAGGKVT
jgi:hypothetical protein